MGLDITAYTRLRLDREITEQERESGDYPYETRVRFWINDDFPGRAGSIKEHCLYAWADDELRFRAGSYSGYGEWRRELAEMVGITDLPAFWSSAAEGPFAEMINFSDCEGVIGPEVSAKLAKDFAEHQPAADAKPEWFRALYAKWRRAFEMAADGGAVAFH